MNVIPKDILSPEELLPGYQKLLANFQSVQIGQRDQNF